MDWDAFKREAPEIATAAEARFNAHELIMLGTLRSDGWPRITPVEFLIVDGKLYLGMMWRSMKARDLLRDPRCVLHSATSDKAGTQGDAKIYATAQAITDLAERARFREVCLDRTDWAPDEPEFHLFAIEVQRAAYVVFANDKQQTNVWPERRGR